MNKDSLQLFLSCLELERILFEFQLSRLELHNREKREIVQRLLVCNERVRLSYVQEIDESFMEVGVENEYVITCELEDLWRSFVEEDESQVEFISTSFAYILCYFIWHKSIDLFKSVIEAKVYQDYVKEVHGAFVNLDDRLGRQIQVRVSERFEKVTYMKSNINEQLNNYFYSLANCIV